MSKVLAPATAAQIEDFDWSKTSLGPRAQWPVALKITVDLIMRSAFPKCLCWGPDMIAIYNAAFIPILGDKAPCMGQPFSRIWAEAWSEIGPIADRALQGEPTFIKNYRLELDRGERSREAWFTFCYSPVADETGKICGFMDTVIETTGEILSERRTRLLNGELRHRIKNAYTKAIAIVRLTFRRAATPEAALSAAISRLRQLDQAQRALLEDLDARLDLRALIADALADSQMGNRLSLRGPPLSVEPEQVFALSLALGELATNAQKYGAWSNDTGKVSIDWECKDSAFRLTWREVDGPPVTPPESRGFGSDLIETGLQREFQGETRLDFAPTGLVFTLSADLPSISDADPVIAAMVAPDT